MPRKKKITDLVDPQIAVAEVPLDPRTGEDRRARRVTVLRAEKFWIEKARENPLFFQEYLIGSPPAMHHKIWLANLFHPEYKRINLIAPRESAKTTVMVCALSWYIGRNPFATNLLLSVSATQAEDRLRAIKGFISSNQRYAQVFPHIKIDNVGLYSDTQSEFTVYSDYGGITYNVWKMMRDRYADAKDPTLFAGGIGSKGIIGRRISGIMLWDDLIDETMLTAAAQDKLEQYCMQSLIPLVKPEGRVANIGTRWMINDLPERLERNPSWRTLTIRALMQDPETGEPRSYWPAWWPVERLEERRQEMQNDALFKIMYLSDPTALSANLFTLASLSQGLPFPIPPLTGVYIGTDLAISLKTYADWNVFTAVGVDSAGNIYLLDMRRFRGGLPDAVSELGRFADEVASAYGRLDVIVAENAGYQAAFGQAAVQARPDLPVASHVPKGDKHHRASLISSIAKNNKLFINKTLPDNLYNVFMAECMNFGVPSYKDDTVDSVSIVLQYIGAGAQTAGLNVVKSPYFL